MVQVLRIPLRRVERRGPRLDAAFTDIRTGEGCCTTIALNYLRNREYYRTISRALRRAELGRHTVICHAGEAPYAEVVAEVADFLVAMERISWCMVTSVHDGRMVVSLRTTDPRGGAERVMKRVRRVPETLKSL